MAGSGDPLVNQRTVGGTVGEISRVPPRCESCRVGESSGTSCESSVTTFSSFQGKRATVSQAELFQMMVGVDRPNDASHVGVIVPNTAWLEGKTASAAAA